MITNTEKAKQLYLACNCNPAENTLIHIPHEGKGMNHVFQSLVMCQLVNGYAQDRANKESWLLDNGSLFMGVARREDKKILEKALYRLERKGFIESKTIGNDEFYRVITDKFYNKELYRKVEIQA